MSFLPTNTAPFPSLAAEASYLRTLPSIRERCYKVFDLAKEGKLHYFTYHPEKEGDVVDYCVGVMRRDYKEFSDIEPHGRWRHLDTSHPRVHPLLSSFSSSVPMEEQAKRLLDLFIVSVLLDAGAGASWKYKEEQTGEVFARSEGLGVASVRMFEKGVFSSDKGQPYRVDAKGLQKLTPEIIGEQMQVSTQNPLVGLEGRSSLLTNLGSALLKSPEFFGEEGRPGNILDFLKPLTKQSNGKTQMPLPALWGALMDGLGPIWPKRHSLGGVELGDVWPCESLKESLGGDAGEGSHFVPFHKLTQWMTYSLLEIFTKVLGWEVQGGEDMTGLPEYRNGGLFIDFGVLQLNPSNPLPTHPTSGLPFVPPSHPAVVEWRAMTVVLLDRTADLIRSKLNLTKDQLTLAQILEGATWKCGRLIAKEKRGHMGGGPPVEIDSDGTVF